jgi:N-methylhydantoinase A/oxoprolinase/acetone carboxylase beta subunit
MVPVVDLVEIGNGGGSIAWVDDFGKLHVGPQSAGAIPGPAAYGKGGDQATTTDANLWLGRINRDYFCGGEVAADMERGRGRHSESWREAGRRRRRGRARHHPHRQQQHGQRAEARLAQPRP